MLLSRFLIWLKRHQVGRIKKNGKIFYKYKGELYPEYLNKGDATSFISDKAKEHCKGRGIDIGADRWPLPGAIPIQNEEGQNAYKLDNFLDGSLDYVFSSHCLEHLDRWEDALRLWIRKLKIDGVLFLYLPHKMMSLWNPHCPWVGSGHKWVPTYETINKFLANNGMGIIEYNPGKDRYWSFHIIAKKASIKMEQVCDVCGGIKTKALFPVIDRSYARTYTEKSLPSAVEIPDFRVVKCAACGHVYIDPVPEEAFLNAFYTRYIDREFDSDFYKDHFRTDYKNFEFGRKMESKCKKIKSVIAGKDDLRLCDVGCGTGIFLHIAKMNGFSVQGVDVNRKLATFARENFSVDVFRGTLGEANFRQEFFDVVTMWDVLEHVPSPSKLLKEANRILKKGGLVAIETPNVDSLLHKLAVFFYYVSFKKWAKPIGIYNVHHLHYFSPSTIEKCLFSNGFHITAFDKDSTNLSQCLGPDHDNVIKRNPILNMGVRLVFWLAHLLKMQNKMVIYAVKV